MAEEPEAYNREFTADVTVKSRRRLGYSHEKGEVTRFVAQLEYFLSGSWVEVVRFDHDPTANHCHDVTKEGVHMDIYRDGEKFRTEEVFPPMEPSEALTYAEDHLNQHAKRYIKRFEEWHGIRSR